MTKVISGFPGVGKSYYCKAMEKHGQKVLDSDSSKFDKAEFPQNYIDHIKENIGEADVILVSSHKEVREALVENDIGFTLVYPGMELKEEYLQRYRERNSPEAFVSLLDKNWDTWISELTEQKCRERYVLGDGDYLSDVLETGEGFCEYCWGDSLY